MKYQTSVLKYGLKDVNAPSEDEIEVELIVEMLEANQMVTTLPKKSAYEGIYLLGDQLRVYKKKGSNLIQNLSCQVLHTARFRRNLNSVMRNLVNESHPLNCVLVTDKKNAYWVIPHDSSLRHDYFSAMSSDKAIKEGECDV